MPWTPSDPKNKKMYEQYSAVAQLRGGKGGHLPPGAAFWGRQIEVEMLRNNYEISNVSGCYELRFTKCRMQATATSDGGNFL